VCPQFGHSSVFPPFGNGGLLAKKNSANVSSLMGELAKSELQFRHFKTQFAIKNLDGPESTIILPNGSVKMPAVRYPAFEVYM
jgi:hypothetical protein